jgi:hypothetical protein
LNLVLIAAALLALPFLIDGLAFLAEVRRQQGRADHVAMAAGFRLERGPLAAGPVARARRDLRGIEWPPRRGAYRGRPDAVRVEADLPWRSPILRLRSTIKVSATVALMRSRSGMMMAGRVE